MFRYTLYLLFVLPYLIATVEAVDNTDLLREFYHKTAYSVQKEGRIMLTTLNRYFDTNRNNDVQNR